MQTDGAAFIKGGAQYPRSGRLCAHFTSMETLLIHP